MGMAKLKPAFGISDDYHNGFALFLARQGYVVLCPELRGFGVLMDMARDIDGARLDYWNWGNHMAYKPGVRSESSWPAAYWANGAGSVGVGSVVVRSAEGSDVARGGDLLRW